MKHFWDRYFAGVRWGELATVTITAPLLLIQAKLSDGAVICRRDYAQAGVAAALAALAYLRVPKRPGEKRDS